MFMVFSCVVRNLLGLAKSAAARRRKKASTGGGAQYRPRIAAEGIRNPVQGRPGRPSTTPTRQDAPDAAAADGPVGPEQIRQHEGINGQGLGAAGAPARMPCAPWDTGWWRPDAWCYSHWPTAWCSSSWTCPRLCQLNNLDFLLLDDLGYLPRGVAESEAYDSVKPQMLCQRKRTGCYLSLWSSGN